MSDPTDLADRLERLAPNVDSGAARELFERTRSGGRAPRWLLPVAVFVLVVAGIAGIWAVNRAGDGAAPQAAPGTSLVTGPLLEDEAYDTMFAGEVPNQVGEGQSSRTDTAPSADAGDLHVAALSFSCSTDDEPLVRVLVETTGPARFSFVVVDGEAELGSASGSLAAGGSMDLGTVLDELPGPDARVLVRYGSAEIEYPVPPLTDDCSWLR